MKKKLNIQMTEIKDRQLQLVADEAINGLAPAGQMLVDSDGVAFIYLLESNTDYTYMVLPEPVWHALKTGLEEKLPVYLTNEENKIELINFYEELEYLISNIKGNSNYGDEMVTKVESTF